jgi:hypothetical protein
MATWNQDCFSRAKYDFKTSLKKTHPVSTPIYDQDLGLTLMKVSIATGTRTSNHEITADLRDLMDEMKKSDPKHRAARTPLKIRIMRTL